MGKFRIEYLLSIIFFVFESLTAQVVSLKGKVVDINSRQAIQGAVVFISYNYMAYTNNDGYYEIKSIPEGNYTVKISRIGFKPLSSNIEIDSNSSVKNFTLTPSPIELDEVLVSTDRTEKYLRNSPYSEVLVNSKNLEDKIFQSVPDVLKEEPGISLLRDGIWGTDVSIRGLNRDNVVTLIDGNRIATSTDVAARLSMINMNDIDRIEVIKGASSSIYGSGATGGIVNIITKQPMLYEKFSMSGNVNAGFSSVNNLSTFAGSFYGGDSFWSSKFSGSYRKAGNIQTPIGELNNSQFEDYSFSGAVNVYPVDNNTVKLEYQLFKANNVGIPGASVFPSNADVRYPDEKRELISAGYDIQNISKMFYKLSLKYSYQFIQRDVENIPHVVQNIAASDASPAKRVSVLKITPGADHYNNNLLVQGNLLLNENNNLVLGVDYWDRRYKGHREKYQLIEVLNPQGDVVNTTNKIVEEKPLPDSKYKSFGMFAQDDAELIKEKLSLTLGARYDIINVEGDKTLNPLYEIVNGVINTEPANQTVLWNKINAENSSYSGNIGLKYSLNSNTDLTLALGLSFRSPSLEERFQYIDQGSYVRVGNPFLNPEKGKSVDLGIRYYQSRLKILASLFLNYFNDLVAEIPGTFEGRNAYIKTNIGQARLYGFDFNTEYNFYNNHILYATASFVKGDDITSGGNLPEIPPLNGVVGIKLNLFGTLETDLSSTIFAEQNNIAAGEIKTPGYAVFNLSVITNKFEIGATGFRICAGIENIFDKNYRNHLSTTRGLVAIEPGRDFYIKLITDF